MKFKKGDKVREIKAVHEISGFDGYGNFRFEGCPELTWNPKHYELVRPKPKTVKPETIITEAWGYFNEDGRCTYADLTDSPTRVPCRIVVDKKYLKERKP